MLTNLRPGQRLQHVASVTNSLAGISWEPPVCPAPVFSEADMKQCSCDLSPDWPDNIPNINPAITCSCFIRLLQWMNLLLISAPGAVTNGGTTCTIVHSFHKNGSSRLIRYTKESGEFYVVSYFPRGHVSLGPLSSISQSQEDRRHIFQNTRKEIL